MNLSLRLIVGAGLGLAGCVMVITAQRYLLFVRTFRSTERVSVVRELGQFLETPAAAPLIDTRPMRAVASTSAPTSSAPQAVEPFDSTDLDTAEDVVPIARRAEQYLNEVAPREEVSRLRAQIGSDLPDTMATLIILARPTNEGREGDVSLRDGLVESLIADPGPSLDTIKATLARIPEDSSWSAERNQLEALKQTLESVRGYH